MDLKFNIEDLKATASPRERYFLEEGYRRAMRARNFYILENLGLHGLPPDIYTNELYAGLCLYEGGGIQPAIARFRKAAATEKNATAALARVLLGACFKARGSNQGALAAFVQAADGGIPVQLRSAILKGSSSALRDAGSVKPALEKIEQAIEAEPGNYRFHFSRGFIFQHYPELGDRDSGHIQRAIEAYEQGMEAGGHDWPPLLFHLAICYGHAGQSAEYVAYLSEAISGFHQARNPHNDLNRGLALILMQDTGGGLALTSNALGLLEADPVKCARRNARAILEDLQHFNAPKAAIENYIDLCEGRLAELENRDVYKEGEWDGSSANLASEVVAAAVAFVDLRGSTEWIYEINEQNHLQLAQALGGFYNLCLDVLYPVTCFTKLIGDGIVMVSRLYGEDPGVLKIQVDNILSTLSELEPALAESKIFGDQPLSLGIGISFGNLIRVRTREGHHDYLGPNMALAARLCNEARPNGLIACVDKTFIRSAKICQVVTEVLEKREGAPLKTLDLSGLKGLSADAVKVVKLGANRV